MKKTLLKAPLSGVSELFLMMHPLHQSRKQLFLFTILLFFSVGVSAQIFVSPTGDDLNSGLVGFPKKTIQAAIDISAAGQVINVEAGTYTLTTAVNVNKEITLQGNANNLAVKPVINGVGNITTKSLIEIDAPNVTVRNFEFQIAQNGDAMMGLTTLTTDNFNNLTIADNVFKGMKAFSTGLAYFTTAVNLGRQSASAVNLISVVRNSITYANMAAPELFGKGIYAYNTYGNIGGSIANQNTIPALYSIAVGEIGGGAGKDFEVSNNILPVGGIIVVGANVGNHKILDNVLGDGFTSKAIADQFLRQIEVRGSRTTGANIEIANNQIKNYSNIGVYIQRSNNISVKNNTFSPITGANAFNSIVFSSKEGTAGAQSPVTSDNISITGNTLNGTGGKGISFWNHNASALVKPLTNVKVGGSDLNKNTFAATLGSYIDLDETASGTTSGATFSTLYDSPQTVTNTTNILPFNSDIDASYNVFGTINTGIDKTVPSFSAVKNKVFDRDDNAALGEVHLSFAVRNVTTLEGFTNIQAAIDDADTQNGHVINVEAGTYTLTTAVNINKEITLQGNANNLAAKPIINGVGNAATKSLIEIDAPNVTVKNFELEIAQTGDALSGITTLVSDNFNNLTITDNIFKGFAVQSGSGFTWLSHAMKIGRGSVGVPGECRII